MLSTQALFRKIFVAWLNLPPPLTNMIRANSQPFPGSLEDPDSYSSSKFDMDPLLALIVGLGFASS